MLLKSITLKNLLSFKDTTLGLRPLNVLIGPNAAGKSNFIEAIGLLQAAPTDLSAAIRRGGGVREWLWKGGQTISPIATIGCQLTCKSAGTFSYELQFSEDSQGFVILKERLRDAEDESDQIHFDRNSLRVAIGGSLPGGGEPLAVEIGSLSPTDSVFARLKNPLDPTPITKIGLEFEAVRAYKEFNTGLAAPARIGVSTTFPKGSLREGGDNLALVLNEMDLNGSLERIQTALNRFYGNFTAVKVLIVEGVARVYLREEGMLEPISAIRLSDGTLKFLCLLAVLLDPKPAPFTCIEEPELGLHPDALQIVADLLVDASERTQLIVTTHSQSLIDALSDRPEAVVVCERDLDNSTQFQRLNRAQLDEWLERYSLGEIWRKGEIGGNRW